MGLETIPTPNNTEAPQNTAENEEQLKEELYNCYAEWQAADQTVKQLQQEMESLDDNHPLDPNLLEKRKQQRVEALDALSRYLYSPENLGKLPREKRQALYREVIERYDTENKPQPYQTMTEKRAEANVQTENADDTERITA